jgi:glutathione S-transferase
MSRSIRIYSFGDFDRSGKVRWTAKELGYEVEESRISYPENHEEAYRSLNPYAQIPTVILDGQVMIESTAICLILAERHPEAGLVPDPGPQREAFWQAINVSTSTLEQMTTNYYLSRAGIIDGTLAGIVEEPLRDRLQTFASGVPEEGCLFSSFTLADIFAAYVLRLAVSAGLLEFEGAVKSYLRRLEERPAAQAANFFEPFPG